MQRMLHERTMPLLDPSEAPRPDAISPCLMKPLLLLAKLMRDLLPLRMLQTIKQAGGRQMLPP